MLLKNSDFMLALSGFVLGFNLNYQENKIFGYKSLDNFFVYSFGGYLLVGFIFIVGAMTILYFEDKLLLNEDGYQKINLESYQLYLSLNVIVFSIIYLLFVSLNG